MSKEYSLYNLKQLIFSEKDKLWREDSNHPLIKEDIEDIEMSYELQSSEIIRDQINLFFLIIRTH